jgi:DNA topoisomerase I
MNLVIVESPAKAKTIKKYLGKDFEVVASYGHVRDLVPKEGAVDPDHGFAMKYQVIERNEKPRPGDRQGSRTAEALYLATDPDREGEAISWHLYELLKGRRQLGTSRCIGWCSTRSPKGGPGRHRQPAPDLL